MFDSPGKPTIICFRNKAYNILEKGLHDNKESTDVEQRLRVVQAAGDIIREDIRSKYDSSVCPEPEEQISNVQDGIPSTLSAFLDTVLLKGKKTRNDTLMKKRDSIAHAIMEQDQTGNGEDDDLECLEQTNTSKRRRLA